MSISRSSPPACKNGPNFGFTMLTSTVSKLLISLQVQYFFLSNTIELRLLISRPFFAQGNTESKFVSHS